MPFMSRPLVVLIDTPDWTWLCFLNMSFVFMLFVLTSDFVHFLQGYIQTYIQTVSCEMKMTSLQVTDLLSSNTFT